MGTPVLGHSGKFPNRPAVACSGVAAEDLIAYVATGVDPTLEGGSTIWIQA